MKLGLTAVAFDSFESWLYVVLALLAVVWVVVAGVVVQRYRKGKLVIRVVKARLGRGREITGLIKVLAYQPIASQELKISLIAVTECEVASGSAGGSPTSPGGTKFCQKRKEALTQLLPKLSFECAFSKRET